MPQSRAGAAYADRSGSWMLPEAKGEDLLYISSSDTGSVYVYTYPQGQLAGTLTGFVSLFGECTDAAGDVFIISDSSFTKNYPSTIYEYAHGGASPIATLTDTKAAFGCAVDSTTGNLAASGAGVAIYKHAAGQPRFYSSPVALHYCGYDGQGNLYVSGDNTQYGNKANLYRLSKGSRGLEQISLNATIYVDVMWPSVQWHGKYLTVSSDEYGKPITIYRFRISGSSGTAVGSTTLTARVNSFFGQTWIQGHTIIGYGAFKRGYQSAYFWPYPTGGQPQLKIKKVGDAKQDLFGAVVSQAPPR
jgi:hypothetical protein